jgi:signal transduction histidine kinase
VLAGTHPDCIAAVEAAQAAENAAELDYLLTEVPRTLTETFEGLDRVTRIVHSLKELSHPKPDKALADLNRAIETAVMVSRHEWKYVADLVTDFELGLPLVPCIVDQFSQVMLNLIVNAAHAVADALKASGAERGRITVRTRLAGRCALVEVQDTGTGIAEEIRGRIFEPFFTTKGVGEGTGQGLAIVRTAIVANHGGTVDFETEVGVGTTFRIRLPLEAGSGTS